MPTDPDMLNSFATVIAERNELLAQLQAAQEREKVLREALERYENEAPSWLKPIARKALADQGEC